MTEHIQTPRGQRDLWVSLGMFVSATAALLSSFDGLRSLAVAAGWGVYMAPLLPLTVDAYAMTATRVWLADSTSSARARRFARSNAVGAIGMSLAGNATWHLIGAHLLGVGWLIVVLVGAVPPAVLGLVSHLAVLRKQVDALPTAVLSTTPEPAPRTQYRTDDELLIAAHAADAAYRAEHGKAITRDELRKRLRVSAARATALLRQLKTEGEALTISRQQNH